MAGHILEEPSAGVLTMQPMPVENGYKAGYARIGKAALPCSATASLSTCRLAAASYVLDMPQPTI